MNDAQLLRYSRHILLDELGIEGQQKLLASRALIVGAGGLGSPVALYLASAGVGHLTIVDDDCIDPTNLQRQIAYKSSEVGELKAATLRDAVVALNPDVNATAITLRAGGDLLDTLTLQTDIVLDCTDNFATRHAINRACVKHLKPLVSGAAIRFDGQVAVYQPRNPLSPCYACVFPEITDFDEVRCATMGVFAPLVGIIGSIQAAEALKLLTATGESLTGRLQMLDSRSMSWSEVKMPRDAACTVCKNRPAALPEDQCRHTDRAGATQSD